MGPFYGRTEAERLGAVSFYEFLPTAAGENYCHFKCMRCMAASIENSREKIII
jgi:hypothetical protein